jgi:hypothetical protein
MHAHTEQHGDATKLHERRVFEQPLTIAERFALSCLNRLQLKNNQQLINLADPFEALAFAGELDNPIARHSPRRSRT